MAQAQPVKGTPWFAVGTKPGDRTLDQQLMGLDPLFAEVEGKTVLDVGCAEGLISIECARRGAQWADGIEVREDAVQTARKLVRTLSLHGDVTFDEGDANTYCPQGQYDIVLMLAVLHKLYDPSAACRRFAAAAKDLVVIRLPPATAPLVVDPRSLNEVHDIDAVMTRSGFVLYLQTNDGPFGEWVGYFRRVRA